MALLFFFRARFTERRMNISKEIFGTATDGTSVNRWTISAEGNGAVDSMQLIDYGASLSSVRWKDREICLGMESLEDYESQDVFLGSTVGPYANRIAGASYDLGGRRVKLDANDGPNNLHSASAGFADRVWQAEAVSGPDGSYAGVEFRILSPHNDGGFPGNLSVRARYILMSGESNDSYLFMHFLAETDELTPVNLTNHAYWNLGGEETGHLRGHRVRIPGERYVDVDADGIPTGLLAESGCGTGAMDLRNSIDLASRIYPRPMADGLELEPILPGGYDHCYSVDREAPVLSLPPAAMDIADLSGALLPRLAAEVEYAEAGGSLARRMDVHTSYPGVQFYTGNFLKGDLGRRRARFTSRSGFCLEAQYFPDSPNHPEFPDCFLAPGDRYEQLTVHHFY
jgi:aldose 1-epimerase